MSQFSQELCKLQSSNMAYTWRLSNCIWDIDLGSLPLFFYFIFSNFLSFSLSDVNNENLSQFSQELLKLESLELVYIWTMTCYIVGLRVGLTARVLLFIYPLSVFSG